MRAHAMKVGRVLAWIVLGANALDLSTSWIPSPADHLAPIAPRSLPLLVAQVILLIVSAALVGALLLRERGNIAARLRAMPMPRAAQLALGAWLAIAALHVALRHEAYPFSPVTMFSSAVPEPTSDTLTLEGYASMRPDGVEVVSFLREGNPAFARHGFGWDYKAGWAMHLYAVGDSRARDVVRRRFADEGLPEPQRVRFEVGRADGRLRLPPGRRELSP